MFGLMNKTFRSVAAMLLPRWFGNPAYDFANKHVLITGGSRGLGLLLARELAKQRARLTLCARSEEELQIAQQELERTGTPVKTILCDVTHREEVIECVQQARAHFGPIDVLINNAGIINVAPAEELILEDFDNALRTHLYGPLYMTMEVLPDMRQRKEGRIVNISSLGGKMAIPHMLSYTVSKFALCGLSEGLRHELRKDGILVTTVCPGVMRTGSHLQAEFKGQNELEYAWCASLSNVPGLTVSGESAAQKILCACSHGKAELVIGIPAKLAVTFNALAPELSARLNEMVNRLLPEPGGIGKQSAKGYESRGRTPATMTSRVDRAALRNNETVPANAVAENSARTPETDEFYWRG